MNAAMVFTNERADAEDLVHTALVRAIERAPSLPDDVNWEAWLRRVVGRLGVDLLRRNKRRKAANHVEPAVLAAPSSEPSPLWTRYSADELHAAFARCTPAQRRICEQHYLEGASYMQIAASLEIPIGTVATRLFRARQAVAKHLRELGSSAPT